MNSSDDTSAMRRNRVEGVDINTESQWYQEVFEPKDDVDYRPVAEYANVLRKEVGSVFESLDKKAEWLFGITLVAIGAGSAAVHEWDVSWTSFIPALLLLVVSAWLALLAKLPRDNWIPFSIRAAIERAENDRHNFDAWLAASFHVAIVGVNDACKQKAQRIKYAGYCLVSAAALMLIPLSQSTP